MHNWNKNLKRIIYISIGFLIFSCQNKTEEIKNNAATSIELKSVELNTNEGYAINHLTGDSIQPVLNSIGEEIITGKKIPANGKMIPKDSIAPPEIISAGDFKQILIPTNIKNITEPKNIQTLNLNSLEKHFSEDLKSKNKLFNSMGKEISSGVKLEIKGKKVKYKPTHPIIAHSPQMKDNSTYNLQFLDVDQKLSSSYLNAILIDKKGNIWMGSWGGGVIMYDGKYFTSFTENEGLSNNHVYSILQDKKGNIWFGTYGGGVNMFDGNSFFHFTEKEGMSNNYIWSILEDKKGNIWFGTDGGGATKFDGKYFTHYTTQEGLSNDVVFSLTEDKKGNIWMGTSGGGVNLFDGKSFTHLSVENGLNDSSVWAIFEDSKENIWFGTGGGVACYNGKSIRQLTTNDGLANKYVYSIKEDYNGDILFGSYGGGLSIYNGKTFENISEANGLSNNYIKAIEKDESGTIWLATDGGGVNKLKRNSYHHYTTTNGLADNYVNVIFEDSKNNLWFGTYGGVSKFNGESFSFLTSENGLKDNYIRSIMEDSKGNIWMGTDQQGVVKYDGKNYVHISSDAGLSANTIYNIIEDKNGNMWFATYGGGVTKYDGNNFIHYTENEGLSNNNTYTIFKDSKENIWIGTWGGGVSKFDGENFIHYTEKEGLSDNHVNTVFEDNNGDIWLGTNHGLNYFDGKSITYFTTENGLSNNVIYSITQEKNGNIWVGSEKGLSCLSLIKGKKSKYEVIYHSVKEDGLKGIDFCLNAALIDKNNNAWFGSGKCLEKLDLNNLKISNHRPEIYFRHLLINENYIDYRNMNDTLKDIIQFSGTEKFENFPLELELPYDQNHLTFHFTAIDWAAPHKIKYQYKLEGLDKQWNPLTEHNYADYRNIPYGKYTFKVRAIGESKKWSKVFEYSFIIHPPWWHTWWFRVIVVSIFAFSLYLLYRWRTEALRKRQKLLEKTVKERTAELVHQKEIVEEKHKEITDSINYAKRLQQAILVQKEEIDKYIPENFLLYKPKDIVAGDFYFFEVKDNYIFYAAADCTGHGVPGAMLSIVCSNALSRSVKEFGLVDPGNILDKTRELILETFEKSKQDVKDGMDISLITINRKTNEIKWAGANNPLWFIENEEMKEIKANKQPIGKSDNPKPFTTHTLPTSISILYLFTDGYADQFGGPSGKKFKYANFQKLLLEYSTEQLETTNQKLEEVFVNWKNDLEQVDDVCIIGVRV